MIPLIEHLQIKAKAHPKKIVFTDSTSDRLMQAIKIIQKEKIANPIVVGPTREVLLKMKEHNIKGVPIIDPISSALREPLLQEFLRIRKHKGLKRKDAELLLNSPDYFGVLLVHLGYADGLVGGATGPTANTVRPALQIIKTKERFHRVSGLFIMEVRDKLFFFADCAVNVKPDAKTLSEIALDSAHTAKAFGFHPIVSLLSFSTKGSYAGPEVDVQRKALALIKKKDPLLVVDGEMQVDAALVPDVARRKCKDSVVQGNANVLIFPDLNSGNIAYKLVERLAKAQATGPILQGLNKPVNDLSRGCSARDIVNLTIITVVQAQGHF